MKQLWIALYPVNFESYVFDVVFAVTILLHLHQQNFTRIQIVSVDPCCILLSMVCRQENYTLNSKGNHNFLMTPNGKSAIFQVKFRFPKGRISQEILKLLFFCALQSGRCVLGWCRPLANPCHAPDCSCQSAYAGRWKLSLRRFPASSSSPAGK